MLGYVKCEPESLLVRQHGLYRALYCGLCRSARRHFGLGSSPFHSYDFVFLAAARLLVLGESYTIEKHRCPTHPFRRRAMVADNSVLRDTAFCQLLLIREKMTDDILDRDTPFFRRLICRLWRPILNGELKRAAKQDGAYGELTGALSAAFAAGREKEKQGLGLDDMCADFAAILSRLASFRTEGNAARILAGLGDKLGRFLYTLDALDDLERDRKKGAFNPILSILPADGGAEAALAEIDAVQRFYLREMELALALADEKGDLAAICENVVVRGLIREERRVLEERKDHAV